MYLFLNVMVSFVIVNQKLTGSALHIEKNQTIYCPGVGADEPLGSIFFSESFIFSPTAHFLQDFHFK